MRADLLNYNVNESALNKVNYRAALARFIGRFTPFDWPQIIHFGRRQIGGKSEIL